VSPCEVEQKSKVSDDLDDALAKTIDDNLSTLARQTMFTVYRPDARRLYNTS